MTVLDQARRGHRVAMIDEAHRHAGHRGLPAPAGYLDGRTLAEVFAWLRPNDLIWNYWVNNYLLGLSPPPFDILYWNADTTRMTAAVHRDFIEIALTNALTKPGCGHHARLAGRPVQGRHRHLRGGRASPTTCAPGSPATAPPSCSAASTRFVLSTSGHIASMVNPPGNPKATFQALTDDRGRHHRPGRAADDAGQATRRSRGPGSGPRRPCQGSWWPDYSAWLAERSGGQQDRPRRLGRKGFRPLQPAPGSYVLDR